MSTPRWTPEQLAAITERQAEVLVSAAAGSGKTAVLIERVRRLALGQFTNAAGAEAYDTGRAIPLTRLLVVTFTNAAAAELRARLATALATELDRPAGTGADPQLVREQLASLPRAQISTFHGFCGEIVRRYGHLRGLEYNRILDEDEARLIRHDLATRFLDRQLARPDDPRLTRLAMAWGGSDGVGPDDLSRARRASGLRRLLLEVLEFRRAQPDPEAWFQATCEWPELDPSYCDFTHPLVAVVVAQFRYWLDGLRAADAELAQLLAAAHPAAEYLKLAQRRAEYWQQLHQEENWDELGTLLATGLAAKQDDIKYKPALREAYRRDIDKDDPWYERIAAEDAIAVSKSELQAWQNLFSRAWAETAQLENETRELIAALWRLARDFERHYQDYKRRRLVADFNDMQQFALRLLAAGDDTFIRDDHSALAPSLVALELRRRFEGVLVDEHQDTNEIQEAIIDLVTREAAPETERGRPRFFVGDLKQSIYAFRLAVPELFVTKREELAGLTDGTGRVIKLQANFRSHPQLLTAINRIFTGLLTPELGGEDYTKHLLLPGRPAEESSAFAGSEPAAELHLIAADAQEQPADEDAGDEAEKPLRLDRVYARVAELILGLNGDAERPIRDRDGNLRPADWRDIVILMRSTANRIETLLATCAARGVPIYAPGRSGFYERPEIADALALLRVIDNPRQDIPLAAVLTGPAVGLSSAEILAVARAKAPEDAPDDPAPDLWQRLQWFRANGLDASLAERVRRFTAELTEWRQAARTLGVAELLWRLYTETGLLIAAAAQPNGEQRIANLYRLHDLARQANRYERQGLSRFLRSLELNRRAAGDLGEAPLLTEAQNVVRVMTVHQAKGLEFPIVIVPDLDKRFNTQDLGGDVLWHRAAGLGGRHYYWPAEARADDPPRRSNTLSRELCRRERQRDLVAEELRILYVALTRARERLLLVGALSAAQLDNPRRQHAGNQARCWLDWVAPQLHAGIEAARDGSGQATCGDKNSWHVQLHTADLRTIGGANAAGNAKPVPDPATFQAAWRDAIRQAELGSRPRLPAKVTVTKLAHRRPQPADASADEFRLPVAAEPLPVQPRFLAEQDREAEPSAAQIGTATHRLIAALDLSRSWEPDELASLVSELTSTGQLVQAAASRINMASVARLTERLSELSSTTAQLYQELPVAMLLAGRDADLLAQLQAAGFNPPEAELVNAIDSVYVQGVIDLLIVTTDRTVVLDFKTDRNADAAALTTRYQAQLSWYCRAVRELLPEHQTAWAIYGLDRDVLVGPEPYGAPK
ncbi:UvrD-helicase domain-containing protein [bacterium]|nr:UvrD-helicase domain-containing protein [bacterium]